MNPQNVPSELAKAVNLKINDFFNLCFNHSGDQDYVFVDFTKMDKITVAKIDIINKLFINPEVRNIFGLN